ncbi:1-deoxy-D-xylulose-5-phosphate synthase [Anaerobaca lacustris]|uniref:1-deoxy-D-xylulose-5-phosphate synthase n=1 Tax=Anaerobaca lacustris TaxID=3044600 RepID=A0AAW6U2A1_9BACT|nr:1-deoxy-D-xylulose-5-phosphate synthase [Sedimentisphaerales bacterium M17dextr]
MSSLLETINSPADLKTLSVPELETLAEEIRQFMLNSISRTGGHLASNLGAVEMTLALHYVFDFKQDKLLWDVGHQCYTHKIVTGRKAGFERLRQVAGISGFPNPTESEYDQFTVGHAGTSVTTAVGMALGEQLKVRKAEPGGDGARRKTDKAEPAAPRIVAFVGDASIVNGTSFEGLNNLGLVKRQLLVVLNDNSMAIDATVGAVAKYFSRFRLSHTYEDLRRTARNILDHVPGIGRGVDEAVEKIKKSIRMVLPPSQLFESLNVPYFGPVDGHDIESLIRLFEALKEVNHPVLLHVYSKKGKGFNPADEGPTRFHSTGPFKINGNCVESETDSAELSFTEAFGEALAELGDRDERVVAITSAMCDGTGLAAFREKHPERFYDVGIAESAAVDIAAGIAKTGLKPVVCIYSTFLQRGFDQVFQEVALQNLPVVFCVDRAGLVGSDGPTHHGLMDIGYMRMMPNMILVAPADAVEMKHALEFALAQAHPVVIRYPKDAIPSDEFVRAASDKPFELGKSILVKRGRRSVLTIASYGTLLSEALKAAQALHDDGIAVDVVNARFAAPVDEKILTGLSRRKGLITLEDHHAACGFGSAVLELASERGLDVGRVRVLAAPRRFIGHDSRRAQLMQVGVTADDIVNAAKEMLNDRGGKRKEK